MRTVVLLGVLLPALAAAQPAPSDAPPPLSARRWSVAIALGPSTVKPSVDAGTRLEMNELQLTGRYRLRPELELALSLVAGSGGGVDNKDVQQGGLVIDVRYRGLPDREWNPYFYGGLGVMALYAKDTQSSTEKKGRPLIRIGAGVEHRWRAFAVDADLVAFAVGKNADVGDPPPMPPIAFFYEREAVTGIAFLIGGSYYF